MINNFFWVRFAFLALNLMTVMGQSIENSENELLKSINKFSSELYTEVTRHETGNILYSPFHAWAILYQLSDVMDDDIKEKMLRLFHLKHVKVNKDRIEEILESVSEVQWRSAVYLDRKRLNLGTFEVPYLVKIKLQDNWNFRETEVNEIDFSKSDEIRNSMNDWIKAQTNFTASNFIVPDDFTDNTIVVTISLTYFKGFWKTKFDDVSNEYFYRQKEEPRRVPTMRVKGIFNHGKLQNVPAKFVELPYQVENYDNTIRMIIIVPDIDVNITTVEKELNDISLSYLLTANSEYLNLYIPKFELESNIDFRMPHENLGMQEMYEHSSDDHVPSKVDKVIHRTMIDVNEYGTFVVSAAKPIGAKRLRRSITENEKIFRADRPFLVLICTDNLILFRGRVIDINITNDEILEIENQSVISTVEGRIESTTETRTPTEAQNSSIIENLQKKDLWSASWSPDKMENRTDQYEMKFTKISDEKRISVEKILGLGNTRDVKTSENVFIDENAKTKKVSETAMSSRISTTQKQIESTRATETPATTAQNANIIDSSSLLVGSVINLIPNILSKKIGEIFPRSKTAIEVPSNSQSSSEPETLQAKSSPTVEETTDEISSSTTNSFSSTKNSFSSTTNSFSSTTNSFSSTTNSPIITDGTSTATTNSFSSTTNSFSSTTNSFSSTTNSFSSTTNSFSSTTNSSITTKKTSTATTNSPITTKKTSTATTNAPTTGSSITTTDPPKGSGTRTEVFGIFGITIFALLISVFH